METINPGRKAQGIRNLRKAAGGLAESGSAARVHKNLSRSIPAYLDLTLRVAGIFWASRGQPARQQIVAIQDFLRQVRGNIEILV